MRRLLVVVGVVMLSLNATLFFYMYNKAKEKDSPLRGTSPIAQRPEKPFSELIPNDKPEPKREVIPAFVDVPKFRDQSGDSVYADVLSHSKDSPFGSAHGRATNVHETAHGIHSYLRNKYTREMGKKVNGLYVLEGRGIILEEPNMRKSRVAEFVPQNLRSYRYNLYIAGQRAWDDTPLYIYDEWAAYILGGMTNVDDVKNGRYKGGWTDGVSGCLGFSIYAIATCMAIEKHDPNYWENNEQFRNATIWLLKRAHKTYMEGRVMEEFKWEKQDKLYNEFLNSDSAAPMRTFVKEHLEGVWLEEGLSVTELQYQEHQRVLLSPDDESLRKIQPEEIEEKSLSRVPDDKIHLE